METVRIKGSNMLYEIRKIQSLQDNTLQIVFDNEVPDEFGDLEVFTKSGTKYATIEAYEKVISIDGKTVILAKADYEEPEASTEPTTEDDLLAMAVDHEYRITLMELGVI